MATTPTNKPIPSEDPRDLKFNAGKIDEVVNSDAHYYTDRFGVRRWTIAGFQYTAEEAIRNYGYITIDSFEDGATLTLPNQVLRYEATGEYYRWDGEFPKTVPSSSTPETAGGVGLGAWVSVGDAALRTELSFSDGYKLIGECPDILTLRTIEPQFNGQAIRLRSHTTGYNLGGGVFRAVLDGSDKTDNNGTVIKTSGGSVWLRENKSEVYAVDFGFIPNNSASATSNATAVVAAAKYAFDIGSVCVLPPDMAYVGDMIFNFPANIRGSHPGSGASLVQRNQTSDLIHTGSGYCFDFPPQLRPNVPADTQDVVDGIRLTNINIRGTNSGLGGIRVNTAASISTVGYERRNTTFSNINIAGYYSGWGYQLFNTFTNHLFNVTVWDCAAIYYIRTAHSTAHVSCVYENCAWGCLAINTECNNHIGGAIEGVRYLPKMTKPVDYDENGNFPTDLGYSQLYAGIGIRTRGGTTLLSGVYIEANKIDIHLEDSCKVTARDCYFNAVSGRTEFNGIGTSGRLVVQGCRFVNAPSSGTRWRRNSASLLCNHAIITQNQYDSLRPISAPDIANVGEFDVYPGTPDLNAVTRIMKSQNTLTSGSTTSTTLTVDSTVVLAGLTTAVPTTTGQLYVDSTGVVKRKQ